MERVIDDKRTYFVPVIRAMDVRKGMKVVVITIAHLFEMTTGECHQMATKGGMGRRVLGDKGDMKGRMKGIWKGEIAAGEGLEGRGLTTRLEGTLTG